MTEQSQKRPVISTNTAISIGLCITLMGCAWFVSGLNTRVETAEDRISTIEAKMVDLAKIKEDVSSIKTDLQWVKSALTNAEIE